MINEILSGLFILIILTLFGLAGGYMAKARGRSFGLGFTIGMFFNIFGLILIAFIGSSFGNHSFSPELRAKTDFKVSAIKQLIELNENGKLSNEEFERLKKDIIEEKN